MPLYRNTQNLNQNPVTYWLTGLPGAGKSTMGHTFLKKLLEMNFEARLLDGDIMRKGLCKDLGFTREDRKENIRRSAEVGKLFLDMGFVVICSFVSPYREDRKMAQQIMGEPFVEVFLDCDVEECKRRDPKGYYKKVNGGLINNFTGMGSPYEPPQDPKIILNTKDLEIEECLHILCQNFVTTQKSAAP